MSAITNNMVAPPDNFSTTLSAGISDSDLTIPVNSVAGLATEGVGVLFSKDANGAVVASSIEFVHWTNISGSNILLSDAGDRGLTGSANSAQAHASGSYFEVWVSSFYYDSARDAFIAEHSQAGAHQPALITGQEDKATPVDADTFLINDSVGAVLSKLTFANLKATLKTYFDTLYDVIHALTLTEAPSNLAYTGITTVMTAGENLVAGDIVYFKSDGKCWKVDADAVATMPAMGMAMATISANATGVILLQGIYRNNTLFNWTVGGLIYASGTPGPGTQTQPAGVDGVIQVIGIATHAGRMYFNPVLTYITHI